MPEGFLFVSHVSEDKNAAMEIVLNVRSLHDNGP
jgi:hypothetical protein